MLSLIINGKKRLIPSFLTIMASSILFMYWPLNDDVNVFRRTYCHEAFMFFCIAGGAVFGWALLSMVRKLRDAYNSHRIKSAANAEQQAARDREKKKRQDKLQAIQMLSPGMKKILESYRISGSYIVLPLHANNVDVYRLEQAGLLVPEDELQRGMRNYRLAEEVIPYVHGEWRKKWP